MSGPLYKTGSVERCDWCSGFLNLRHRVVVYNPMRNGTQRVKVHKAICTREAIAAGWTEVKLSKY